VKRDPLFFELFKELPGCFFYLVQRPEQDAEKYRLEAIEYKATSVRLDGVFRPATPDAGPTYLWEAQFHTSDKVYANLLSKIGHFLEHDGPDQDWIAVAIYPHRAMEQKNLHPYRCLINSEQLVRIYLDEMPPAGPEQLELGILELIAAKPEAALDKARSIIPRVKASDRPQQLRRMLIQFVETIILYQFPNWSRKEMERMLQVTDIRQTRIYQEALEEGRQEGAEEKAEAVARRLLEKGFSVVDVAEATELSVAHVRKLGKKPKK
jgi:predicted transposase/invertase (TIGR01784 family)